MAGRLAWFLEHTHSDRSFWLEWKRLHPSQLRSLQALCFSLVHLWYDCELPSEIQDDVDALPKAVKNWVDEFGYSPIHALHDPTRTSYGFISPSSRTGLHACELFAVDCCP